MFYTLTGSENNQMKKTDKTITKHENEVPPFEPFLGPYNPNYLLNKTNILSNNKIKIPNSVEVKDALPNAITSYNPLINSDKINSITEKIFAYEHAIASNNTSKESSDIPIGIINPARLNNINNLQQKVSVKNKIISNYNINPNLFKKINDYHEFHNIESNTDNDKNKVLHKPHDKNTNNFQVHTTEEVGLKDSKPIAYYVPLKQHIQQKNQLNIVPFEINRNIPYQNE